ncbi:mpv17-like protein 2 isoform X3 [Melitaea cinxia]|uniref:mpv17-like protein 2 isoform X3 n=1 Tax=Melitaea cinxia TaxID=113334 RepID=UPI001E2719BE|nr:mpv17-like protein 2 isoform X3 [Melitaea cinxia]
MSVLSKNVIVAFKKYPVLRGMASYGIIWPISSFIQQTFEGKRFDSDNKYDWLRCARFGLYGSCYVAPTLYSWLTVASIMWPGNMVRSAIVKVGASVWPAVAMINFSLIPEKNRVPFISVCSLIWTCFLAYMKHLDKDNVALKSQQSSLLLKV